MTTYLMTAVMFLLQMGRDGRELFQSLRASLRLADRLANGIAGAFIGLVFGVFYLIWFLLVGGLGAAGIFFAVKFIKWAWLF